MLSKQLLAPRGVRGAPPGCRGNRPPQLQRGMPLPLSIVGGQETRLVFQFGNKTRTLCSIESKFPRLTLRREAQELRRGEQQAA